jgi:ribosome maturation factor RimP
MKINKSLLDLLEPVVTGLGFELVGAEYDGHQRVLRLYIDHPDGVGLEECSKVSYQVSGVLDVEDPIPGRYQLEVSSPGMERPLFTLAHFQRFQGDMARIQLSRPIEGRRRFKAQIVAIEGDEILLLEEGKEYRIPFDQIEKAKLAPVFD